MLSDDDPQKWGNAPHTRAKHEILVRYMKAWLPILRIHRRLVIVDAFAGRGRYTTEEPGSPLLLRDIAGRVAGNRDFDVDLYYIERNPANAKMLAAEIAASGPLERVVEHDPICDTFEGAAPGIVDAIRRAGRPSFWFIDPFGYAGLPLSLVNRILSLPRAEVLVTLMVQDINRFLENANHQTADAQLFGLEGDELLARLDEVKQSPDRVGALRDLYVERLEATTAPGHRRFVTSVGVARRGPTDIIYFLVHSTGHPKGKREMKEAMFEALGGFTAFLGASHPAVMASESGQLDLFTPEVRMNLTVDYTSLRALLRTRFSGRRSEYERVQNETAVGHEFDGYTDNHIKKALEDLAHQGRIRLFRNNLPSKNKLRPSDVIEFPPA
ncbi:MAG: three-Cys-motif partner protein TcmP [Chloroflexi bacterium]|nr:three-Cys-motif partner protein TcmP [Chloroflexota bacterium]